MRQKKNTPASIELQSWYEASLRPRLARAARLGLVDERRLIALDDDLSRMIGSEDAGEGREPSPAKAA